MGSRHAYILDEIKVWRIGAERGPNGSLVTHALVQQLPGEITAFRNGKHLGTGKHLDQALEVSCIIVRGSGRLSCSQR